LDLEAKGEPAVIARQGQAAPVEGGEHCADRAAPERFAAGASRMRIASSVTTTWPSAARRLATTFFRLARAAQVGREHRGEIGLGIGADDAKHIDDGLELASMPDEY
jgi:hypothetical protein